MRKALDSCYLVFQYANACCRYDMYGDVEEKLAAKRGDQYNGKFICGLPIGLELPSGITVGVSA